MDLSLIFQATILGVAQGLTEFLPISSSAHLILIPWLLGWDDPVLESLPFDVALHLGTLLAVLWFFRRKWVALFRAGISSIAERKIDNDTNRRLAWLIVLGSVPAFIIGGLFESRVEELFHAPNEPLSSAIVLLMAGIIAFFGALMFAADRLATHLRAMEQFRWLDALLIGLAQAAAIFPGVSRSGATLTAGLFLGMKRADAARYSFLLSAPLIAGASLKSGWDVFQEYQDGGLTMNGLLLFPIGFTAAAITGWLAIRFLLNYLQRNTTDIFVYYRWAVALALVVIVIFQGSLIS